MTSPPKDTADSWLTIAFIGILVCVAAYQAQQLSNLRKDLDGLQHQSQRRLDGLEEVNRRETFAPR